MINCQDAPSVWLDMPLALERGTVHVILTPSFQPSYDSIQLFIGHIAPHWGLAA